jgi:hypothetical protein
MPRIINRRPTPAICPACGSDKARVELKKYELHEPDIEGSFFAEVTQCDECGESVLTLKQAEAHARAYATAAARTA